MTGLDVETSGSGPDVVLLHSLLTDRSSFAELAGRLATERRVALVNLPGFGKSPPAEPLAGYADRWPNTAPRSPQRNPTSSETGSAASSR